jgi:hypothetical protein
MMRDRIYASRENVGLSNCLAPCEQLRCECADLGLQGLVSKTFWGTR